MNVRVQIHTKCTIEGCEGLGIPKKSGKFVYPKGYCNKHYYRFRVHGDPNFVTFIIGEDRRKHPLYEIYTAMLGRCNNPSNKGYKNYGGRGITVCDEWQGVNGFSTFIKDMGERPEGTSLDRERNNEGYSKENCRWATRHVQSANRRHSNKCVGVSYHKREKAFISTITVNGIKIGLGMSRNYDEAVAARKSAELKYLGYNV